jgi:molecular chaperone DnaK
LKQAIKDKNLERIKKSMESLTAASHKLAEAIYAQTAQKQQTDAAQASGGGREKVVDAEYEEAEGRR